MTEDVVGTIRNPRETHPDGACAEVGLVGVYADLELRVHGVRLSTRMTDLELDALAALCTVAAQALRRRQAKGQP